MTFEVADYDEDFQAGVTGALLCAFNTLYDVEADDYYTHPPTELFYTGYWHGWTERQQEEIEYRDGIG